MGSTEDVDVGSPSTDVALPYDSNRVGIPQNSHSDPAREAASRWGSKEAEFRRL